MLTALATGAAVVIALMMVAWPPAAVARQPDPGTKPELRANVGFKVGTARVVTLAQRELGRRVVERRGNNVPRYHGGKGRIAPYSIHDSWCVAFATWIWSRVGFDAYRGTDYLRISEDGTAVAIQVKDLSRWAKRNGHWSTRARPGYLVAYGRSHMGVVERINRNARAVHSIEGNKSDQVSSVNVPMADVAGYISPVRLKPAQLSALRSLRADID